MDRILIVDDNPKNIQLLGNILSELDYEIEYAQDGLEAVETVALDDFDLILMDVMMPEMDGYEACKEIKKNKDKKDIPLIFITAKTDVESITHGFEIGGVDYISKPFNAAELLSRVETHISLKKSKDKLKNMNIILESKVKQRTKELLNSNKKLMLANENLEVLDNAKTEFLNIISHEIRTPLNGILGMVDCIKVESKDELGSELIDALDSSCRRLEKFSFNALHISELTTEKLHTLSKKEINLGEIINEVLLSSQSEIESKQLIINNSVSAYSAIADSRFIEKCFRIIISNAVKHSPAKGMINIGIKEQKDSCEITFKDEGTGFPEMILKDGIKPFSSSKHIDNNPGLELYLCKLIVEAHKGSIKIANDNGGIVKIKIPVS